MSAEDAPKTLDRGRYHIERVLGVGGTATVYLATDTRMGVPRAIKLLNADFARSSQNRARFMNEAHAQAGLKHPNVLMVHDVLDDDQGLYMVMELAESDSLGMRVAHHGTLSAKETAEVGVKVGGALSAAHSAGVIHRDIKPANILVDRHGVLKLADFGIARVLDRERQLTRTGTVMGTWAYMPPEQREDTREVDHRADIYSLGVTLHALYTGRHSPNLHNREFYAEAFGDMPEPLAAIVQQATRLYPEDRYQHMDELVAALRAIIPDLDGPSLDDGDVTDPGGELLLRGAPDPGPQPQQAGQAGQAAEGSTAVPVAQTHQTWIPSNTKEPRPAPEVEPPPDVPPPGAGPHTQGAIEPPEDEPAPRRSATLPLLVAGLVAFVVVAAVGAVVGPRLMDGTVPVEPPETADVEVHEAGADDGVEGAEGAERGDPGEQDADGEDVGDGRDGGSEPEGSADAGDAEPEAAAPAGASVESAANDSTDAGPKLVQSARRIITVRPSGGDGASAAPAAAAEAEPDLGPTGTLLVRTVPSDNTVAVGGRALRSHGAGRYELPVGTHLVELSVAGERHTLPVQVRADQTVQICYNFDTNSACGGNP